MFGSKNQCWVLMYTLFILFLLITIYYIRVNYIYFYELKVLNDLQYFSLPGLTKLTTRQGFSQEQTISPVVKKLHPWWVTGYTDGEGCFIINTLKAKTIKIGYTVKLKYQISVHLSPPGGASPSPSYK